MNMSIISIQMKSKDKRFPMNGKILTFVNVHSVGCTSDILSIKYEDNTYKIISLDIPMDKISYFFIS